MFGPNWNNKSQNIQYDKCCVWTNAAWTNVAWTNVTWTDVAWTDVAWTNVAWTNVNGTRKVKDGSTSLKCPLRYFPWGGGGGWVKVETKAISVQQAGAGTELGKKNKKDLVVQC